MKADRFYFTMLILLFVFLGYLTYLIFQPFLTAIAWAIVFCVVFYPAYAFMLRYIKVKSMAALFTLILIIIAVVGPFSYISFALISEISDFIGRVSAADSETVKSLLSDKRIGDIIEKIRSYAGVESKSEEIVIENIKKLGKGALDNLAAGFSNILSVAANFFLMLFAAFFFLKDGPEFLLKIKNYLPFSEQNKEKLARQVKDMIVSTIYGGVVVAIAQGTLGGLAFALLKINSPVLWGSVMAITSFIPMFGTAIIWLPASIILMIQGAYAKGIALILIGVFVISMVDNILKPLIIGGRTKMPTVAIFFTVLGGIKLFGPLGLVIGPMVFALFMSVFEIFRNIEGGENA